MSAKLLVSKLPLEDEECGAVCQSRPCPFFIHQDDGIMMKNIISLLTHSSSPGSAGFPSGCCRLTLWPSDHCQSESLAGKQTAAICRCTICDSHQLLWCYRLCLFPAVCTVVFSFGHRCKKLPEQNIFFHAKRQEVRQFSDYLGDDLGDVFQRLFDGVFGHVPLKSGDISDQVDCKGENKSSALSSSISTGPYGWITHLMIYNLLCFCFFLLCAIFFLFYQ